MQTAFLFETSLSRTAPMANQNQHISIGDHCPIFSCPDCEGGLFDFYSHVVGKPVVMIFTGKSDLIDLAKYGLSPDIFNEEKCQVVTFAPGVPGQVLNAKTAAGWPFQTGADPNGEITQGFSGVTGIEAPCVIVLNPNQRIVGIASLSDTDKDIGTWINGHVDAAQYVENNGVISSAAPALIIPRALEPEDCTWLIDLWRNGDTQQGQVALGASQSNQDDVVLNVKRREDYIVQDQPIYDRIVNRIMPRLMPEMEKIYHFTNFQMEPLRVGCYKADDAGFFKVHRDDSNPSVKDRKYAMTLNLNTGEYEGGDLRFPEYGPELFRPPAGGAVIFSCSMLHEVLPVTKGERFVLLTFFTQSPTR